MKNLATRFSASITVTPEQRERIAERLLAWYRLHKRDLPWRGGSPYAVWISEIMLQQTQVVTVIPFFLRFMARFPTLQSLASAPMDDVLQQWAGLGYYARARNLHRAAQQMVAEYGARVPNTPEEIERLPGIGRYTAGAILSIAYDLPRPLVDANVVRVLCRIFGVRGDPKSTANQAALWLLAEQLVSARHPGDFNQGLMELGALVCRPDEPLCEQCPLLPECVAGNSPDPTVLPEIPPGRATVTMAQSSAIVLRESGSLPWENAAQPDVLIVQRPLHGLWGGLWEFPRVVCDKGEDPATAAARAAREAAGLEVEPTERIAVVKHSVTHHRITLRGYLAHWSPAAGEPRALACAAVRWAPIDSLDGYAFAAPQGLLREALRKRMARTAHVHQPALEL